MLTKDTAICIRAVDYSETSQIVTLFTRATGKISAIAKGSKRPKSVFDGPIEVFSYGEIVFSEPAREKLATLTEFEQQPSFTHLSNSLFALNSASFATELVNNLTNEYDPHPQLFDDFLEFLQNTDELQAKAKKSKQQDVIALLILFQLALLKNIGLQPVLNACANCKTKYEQRATSDEFYFSSSANGLICGDCEGSFPDKIRLSKEAASCLNDLKLITQSDEKTLNEIERTLIYHFTEILGRPPKMASYILKN
ncbi:MAG: DNA repair protein RecO [Planctomycetota bacterium]|nr:MAG: DNA repair protein RecO [Planctomycetota bacterium]